MRLTNEEIDRDFNRSEIRDRVWGRTAEGGGVANAAEGQRVYLDTLDVAAKACEAIAKKARATSKEPGVMLVTADGLVPGGPYASAVADGADTCCAIMRALSLDALAAGRGR